MQYRAVSKINLETEIGEESCSASEKQVLDGTRSTQILRRAQLPTSSWNGGLWLWRIVVMPLS